MNAFKGDLIQSLHEALAHAKANRENLTEGQKVQLKKHVDAIVNEFK